jgi:hypothetical protein
MVQPEELDHRPSDWQVIEVARDPVIQDVVVLVLEAGSSQKSW